MTFDEFCTKWNVTPEERRALNIYLAVLRLERILTL